MKKNIASIYKALPNLLLPWFAENARVLPWRQDKQPYHVWLSEIMLQQTRVEAVRGYFLRFLQAFPDIHTLAEAEEEAVFKLWEGLGYYSRARNLIKAAKIVMKQHGGQFPTAYKDILALPGIGEYTAGAISSICFEAPEPAVDGNVLRVSARVTDSHAPVTSPHIKKEVTAALRQVYPKADAVILPRASWNLVLLCVHPVLPDVMPVRLPIFVLAKRWARKKTYP